MRVTLVRRAVWLATTLVGCVWAEPLSTVEWGTNAVHANSAYVDALDMLGRGQQSAAETWVAEACLMYPTCQRLVFLQGVLKRSRFDSSAAFVCFSQSYALGMETAPGRAGFIVSSMDKGFSLTAGFEQLRALSAQYPDDVLLRWLFAIQCREHRRYAEEAAAQFEAILSEWDPGPALVHQTYANILTEALGQPEAALSHRWLAAELEPTGWTYQGLANTLKALDRYEEAFEVYAKMLELDPLDAGYWGQWGGALFEYGSYDEAEEKFRQAYACNPSDVTFLLFLGRSLERQGRLVEGFVCYEKACKQNPSHRFAAIYAALSKLYGYGTAPNFNAAADFAKPLSSDALERPADKLAMCLIVSEKDPLPLSPERVEVLHAHLEALAVDGNSAAQYNLGRIYEGSMGIDRNLPAALNWFKQAYENGDADAAKRMASIYARGGSGVKRNLEQAFQYYLQAAEMGHTASMLEVGRRYLRGTGVEPNLEQAVKWIDRCGQQEDCDSHPYRLLGVIYKDGKFGGEKDWTEAARWYAKGWEYGDATCLRVIGTMYEAGGAGFPQDIERAIEIYQQLWDDEQRWHHAARALVDLYCACEDPAYRDSAAAVELALDMVQLYPKSSVCMRSLAKAYAYHGQFDKAVARHRDSNNLMGSRFLSPKWEAKDWVLQCYLQNRLPIKEEAVAR